MGSISAEDVNPLFFFSSSFSFLLFLNYETIIIHLQETW